MKSTVISAFLVGSLLLAACVDLTPYPLVSCDPDAGSTVGCPANANAIAVDVEAGAEAGADGE